MWSYYSYYINIDFCRVFFAMYTNATIGRRKSLSIRTFFYVDNFINIIYYSFT